MQQLEAAFDDVASHPGVSPLSAGKMIWHPQAPAPTAGTSAGLMLAVMYALLCLDVHVSARADMQLSSAGSTDMAGDAEGASAGTAAAQMHGSPLEPIHEASPWQTLTTGGATEPAADADTPMADVEPMAADELAAEAQSHAVASQQPDSELAQDAVLKVMSHSYSEASCNSVIQCRYGELCSSRVYRHVVCMHSLLMHALVYTEAACI